MEVIGNNLGLVIQSIVSLTTSLRRQLVKYMSTALSNTLSCKRFSHFFNKKEQCICNIYFQNFNETVINDVVNFEQLKSKRMLFFYRGHIHEARRNRYTGTCYTRYGHV